MSVVIAAMQLLLSVLILFALFSIDRTIVTANVPHTKSSQSAFKADRILDAMDSADKRDYLMQHKVERVIPVPIYQIHEKQSAYTLDTLQLKMKEADVFKISTFKDATYDILLLSPERIHFSSRTCVPMSSEIIVGNPHPYDITLLSVLPLSNQLNVISAPSILHQYDSVSVIVSFLPYYPETLAMSVLINTSNGSIVYNITATSTQNPYRVYPFSGQSVLLSNAKSVNSSTGDDSNTAIVAGYEQTVVVYNPHAETLYIKEVYITVSSNFSMKLKSIQGDDLVGQPVPWSANVQNWVIESHTQKDVIIVSLDSSTAGMFTGYVHLVTSKDKIVIPALLTAIDVGIKTHPTTLDFGAVRVYAHSNKTLPLYLYNEGINDIEVISIVSATDDKDITISMDSNRAIPSKVHQHVASRLIANITYTPNAAASGPIHGKLLIITNHSSPALAIVEISYSANPSSVSLDVDVTSTTFLIPIRNNSCSISSNTEKVPLTIQKQLKLSHKAVKGDAAFRLMSLPCDGLITATTSRNRTSAGDPKNSYCSLDLNMHKSIAASHNSSSFLPYTCSAGLWADGLLHQLPLHIIDGAIRMDFVETSLLPSDSSGYSYKSKLSYLKRRKLDRIVTACDQRTSKVAALKANTDIHHIDASRVSVYQNKPLRVAYSNENPLPVNITISHSSVDVCVCYNDAWPLHLVTDSLLSSYSTKIEYTTIEHALEYDTHACACHVNKAPVGHIQMPAGHTTLLSVLYRASQKKAFDKFIGYTMSTPYQLIHTFVHMDVVDIQLKSVTRSYLEPKATSEYFEVGKAGRLMVMTEVYVNQVQSPLLVPDIMIMFRSDVYHSSTPMIDDAKSSWNVTIIPNANCMFGAGHASLDLFSCTAKLFNYSSTSDGSVLAKLTQLSAYVSDRSVAAATDYASGLIRLQSEWVASGYALNGFLLPETDMYVSIPESLHVHTIDTFRVKSLLNLLPSKPLTSTLYSNSGNALLIFYFVVYNPYAVTTTFSLLTNDRCTEVPSASWNALVPALEGEQVSNVAGSSTNRNESSGADANARVDDYQMVQSIRYSVVSLTDSKYAELLDHIDAPYIFSKSALAAVVVAPKRAGLIGPLAFVHMHIGDRYSQPSETGTAGIHNGAIIDSSLSKGKTRKNAIDDITIVENFTVYNNFTGYTNVDVTARIGSPVIVFQSAMLQHRSSSSSGSESDFEAASVTVKNVSSRSPSEIHIHVEQTSTYDDYVLYTLMNNGTVPAIIVDLMYDNRLLCSSRCSSRYMASRYQSFYRSSHLYHQLCSLCSQLPLNVSQGSQLLLNIPSLSSDCATSDTTDDVILILEGAGNSHYHLMLRTTLSPSLLQLCVDYTVYINHGRYKGTIGLILVLCLCYACIEVYLLSSTNTVKDKKPEKKPTRVPKRVVGNGSAINEASEKDVYVTATVADNSSASRRDDAIVGVEAMNKTPESIATADATVEDLVYSIKDVDVGEDDSGRTADSAVSADSNTSTASDDDEGGVAAIGGAHEAQYKTEGEDDSSSSDSSSSSDGTIDDSSSNSNSNSDGHRTGIAFEGDEEYLTYMGASASAIASPQSIVHNTAVDTQYILAPSVTAIVPVPLSMSLLSSSDSSMQDLMVSFSSYDYTRNSQSHMGSNSSMLTDFPSSSRIDDVVGLGSSSSSISRRHADQEVQVLADDLAWTRNPPTSSSRLASFFDYDDFQLSSTSAAAPFTLFLANDSPGSFITHADDTSH